nr:hypothetical protein Itr_chr03CG23870 [Ipomoea trifida]
MRTVKLVRTAPVTVTGRRRFQAVGISIGAPARNRSFWYFLFAIIEVVSYVVRRHVSVAVGGSYERQMGEAKFGVHAVSHGRDETSSICHVTAVEPISKWCVAQLAPLHHNPVMRLPFKTLNAF